MESEFKVTIPEPPNDERKYAPEKDVAREGKEEQMLGQQVASGISSEQANRLEFLVVFGGFCVESRYSIVLSS